MDRLTISGVAVFTTGLAMIWGGECADAQAEAASTMVASQDVNLAVFMLSKLQIIDR
jgi:hypothetical protein